MKAMRIFLMTALLAAIVGVVRPAAGALTHAIQGLETTNYTGYVIDADAATLDRVHNRQQLLVQSRVRTTNPDAAILATTYYLRYRLLNSQGLPHPLFDSTGTTPPDATYNLTNTFGLAAGANISRTNVAALRPATRLSPDDRYTVELRVFVPGGIRESDRLTNAPQPFIHFTNLVSADAGFNVVGTVDQVTFTQSAAVRTDPDRSAFAVDVDYTLHRYDNFQGAAAPADAVPITLAYQLVDQTTGQIVPLDASTTNFNRTLFRYTPPPPDNPHAPWAQTATRTIQVRPATGIQLDSVDHRYRLVATLSHLEQSGVPASARTDSSASSSAAQLLHFNGNLRFGALNTTFSSIDNIPPRLGTTPGSHATSLLSIDDQSGLIPGLPGITYGDGTDLHVRLLVNGDAEADADEIPIQIPAGGITKVLNVRMELVPPAALTPQGLVSGLRVHLPTGLGYRSDTSGHRLRHSFMAAAVPLDTALRPSRDVVFTPSGPIYAVEESKPIWWRTTGITWRVAAGRFDLTVAPDGATHVRSDEYEQLAAVDGVLENPGRSLKRSNDRVYHAGLTVTARVSVTADTQCVARLTAGLSVGPGTFRTHFPYDAQIAWLAGGTMAIAGDLIESEASELTGVSPVVLNYGTGCTGVDCQPDDTTRLMRLLPTNGVLRFTRDGGLVAGGDFDAPHRLRWGYIESLAAFAHEAATFTQASFHMPGHALRGDQIGAPLVLRPATLLYTGVAATNTAYLERPDGPGTPNQVRYERGFADYAGMNVAVGVDGLRQGQSTLAGRPTGAYQLKGISKYYARRGGVSGIHDAVPNSFPPTLSLYGYHFDFANFGLSALDNRMIESRIDGEIDLPFPSEFSQTFAGLRLNCLGGIENTPMPAPSTNHPLAYWNGHFDALALQFRRDPEELCNVTNAFLTLGARTQIAHVQEPLYGTLGFTPDGNLIPRAVGPADLDSRLKLPNVIRLAGPRQEVYTLNPVADVYFNGHDQISPADQNSGAAPPVGWVNIAASMDVPFFEDLQVHVQTSAVGGSSNAPIHLLGGWPTHGWESPAGMNFFTAAYFDDRNRGYAQNRSPNEYRESGTDAYHPRARRTWLKIIDFDYPLTWSSTTRDFRSRAPIVKDLMVLSAENQLKYLSAENAEITFGAQFDGLPQLNLANLAYQAIDLATDAGADFTGDLLTGCGRLDEILGADLHPFFGGIFDQSIQPKVDELYDSLVAAYDPLDPANWPDAVGDEVTAAFQTDPVNVRNRLQGMAGAALNQPGMMRRLTNYLAEAEQAVAQVESILAEDPAGNRHLAAQLMQTLVHNAALEFAGGFLDQFVQPILQQADPTLDQIHLVLTNLRTALAQVRAAMADPAGGLGAELQDLFSLHAPEITAAVPAMISDVGSFIQDIDLALDSPVDDYSPEEIKQRIRREIEDRFHGLPLVAGIQVVHKQRLYDVDAALRQATDTVFQELNNVIRLVIGETAEELNSTFAGLLAPLDQMAATAKLNGYAHINGDSLKEARVDLRARLDFGSALEFNGYLQIKELDSQGSAGCNYGASGAITEVTLGAEDVQVGWISPDLRASVGTKFSFDDDGVGFPLRGLGGSFELTGKLDYETFAINFLGASVALGADENYLSAAAGMRVNKYDVFGGIYFGRTCSLDPIRLWDPEAASLLGTPPFTGIYAYGEGWIPINELIGIPASCLFNISAGLGFGAGVFLEGPTFLAKMKAGVSGEALCLVGIKGELTGTAVLEGLDPNVLDGLTVKAKGTVGGSVGPCPICLGLEQSVALTFKQGKWKLDF